jgi:hypothetical protein
MKGQRHCHAVHSEASPRPASQMLRGVYTECNECAQDDNGRGCLLQLIMLIHTITQTPAGADLSRTPPIYRPSVAFAISLLYLVKFIICLSVPNPLSNWKR